MKPRAPSETDLATPFMRLHPRISRWLARWNARSARRQERRLNVLWPSVACGCVLLLLAYESAQHRDTRVELEEVKAEIRRLTLPNGRDSWDCMALKRPGLWACRDKTRKM